MIDNEEETAKSVLTSIGASLSEIAQHMDSISSSLYEIAEMLREGSFTFNRGEARAFRTSHVD